VERRHNGGFALEPVEQLPSRSANAGAAADSRKGFITAFRDHLKTCSRLPDGVNVTDNAGVVLRAFLKPDGTLAARPQPIRIEGVVRQGGEYPYESIVAALRECQPYNLLPPNSTCSTFIHPAEFLKARQREQQVNPSLGPQCTGRTTAHGCGWDRMASQGTSCAHIPLITRDGAELVSEIAGDIYPQFHMFPIGVCVQQGPKPPPFHRPL
jgi:hypothetical protein